jgi:hypothetical protein
MVTDWHVEHLVEAMRFLLLFCLLIPSAVYAQPKRFGEIAHTVHQTINADGSLDTVVEANGHKYGIRENPKTGEIWELFEERNPWTFGATKRMHAHKAGPFPPEQDPLPPPPDSQGAVAPDVPPVGADTAITMDILMAYSDAAAAQQGGVANMPAFAASAQTLWNETAARSGRPNVIVRVLGPVRVSYSETTSGTTALNWAQGAGATEVQALRNQYGADLVHFVVTNDACGLGYQPASIAAPYSESARSCTVANQSFPHETGHNIGMHHDKPNAGCGTTCTNDYYGYCIKNPDGTSDGLKDVMTYPSPCGGSRDKRFSNKDVNDSKGNPTGTTTENNIRIFDANIAGMAAWRAPIVTNPHKPSKFTNFRITQ